MKWIVIGDVKILDLSLLLWLGSHGIRSSIPDYGPAALKSWVGRKCVPSLSVSQARRCRWNSRAPRLENAPSGDSRLMLSECKMIFIVTWVMRFKGFQKLYLQMRTVSQSSHQHYSHCKKNMLGRPVEPPDISLREPGLLLLSHI